MTQKVYISKKITQDEDGKSETHITCRDNIEEAIEETRLAYDSNILMEEDQLRLSLTTYVIEEHKLNSNKKPKIIPLETVDNTRKWKVQSEEEATKVQVIEMLRIYNDDNPEGAKRFCEKRNLGSLLEQAKRGSNKGLDVLLGSKQNSKNKKRPK